jgi:hypothetical protein
MLLADAMEKEVEIDGVSLQLPIANEDLNEYLIRETVPEKIYSPIKLITKDNLSDAGKDYKDE